MNEIDVSKCDYYRFGECYRYDFPLSCAKCSDCYYKQLQQLKAENDKLEQKLENIKEYANKYLGDADRHYILQIIERLNND